jgi:hypothetical protein
LPGSYFKTVCPYTYIEKFVESFFVTWYFQPLIGSPDTYFRNQFFSGPVSVSSDSLLHLRLKEIPGNFETPGFGRFYVLSSLGSGQIGIIHHKPLLRTQANLHELGFFVPRIQHIQRDPDMRLQEVVPVKGSLTRSLKAAEDDGLHGR